MRGKARLTHTYISTKHTHKNTHKKYERKKKKRVKHLISDVKNRRTNIVGHRQRRFCKLPAATTTSTNSFLLHFFSLPTFSLSLSLSFFSQQLGPVIGRGGFGVVYQGLCVKDGAFVAIKQIKLGAVSEDQKKSIMSEIQLLRRLNNKNIVHYITYSATDLYLNIVMEYVENGSLLKILDKYGRFPETLVAAYMYQVLEGLVYLHEQGVVHRDIKGANLLVTKDGTIKIADFGISATRDSSDLEDVSGTPYWSKQQQRQQQTTYLCDYYYYFLVAPEIIELSGATTKSDIWSVGCTVVELLTGKPPYFELSPMSVMFHIVQDEYPPLPESISNV